MVQLPITEKVVSSLRHEFAETCINHSKDKESFFLEKLVILISILLYYIEKNMPALRAHSHCALRLQV